MRIQKYDFTAPDGAHFGIIQPLADIIAAIPNPVDHWTPTAESMTLQNGRITEWTGASGRVLEQDTESMMPILDGSEVLFGDGAAGSRSLMSLSGTAIGAVTDLTIAGKFRLPAGAIYDNVNYLFGQTTGQVFRIAHRYANSNNFLRLDTTSPAVQIDLDLEADATDVPVVAVISGGTGVEVHVGDTTATGTLGASLTLTEFILCSVNLTQSASNWSGWVGNFGIWKTVPSESELASLKQWVS